MNKGHRGMMFLIFLLFGILINLQFRGIVKSESQGGYSVKNLKAELQAEKAENVQLMEQLNNIEAEYEQLLKNIGTNLNNKETKDLLKARDYEYLRAGLVPVSGRGVIITMEDAKAIGELDIEDYIIHDNDVNDILDELKANGAEAISINDERVILTTKPVCAGPTVIVNDNRYPSPYVIKAIGDPDALFEAIETMPQVAFMRLADIRIDIVKQDEIVVDKYHLYRFRSLDEVFKDLEVVKK